MADKKQVLGRAGRVEREQRQTKILTIASTAVIGSIVLVLVVGAIMVGAVQPRQPILEVNGVVVDTVSFQERVRLTRYTLIQQYSNTFNFMMQFGQENPQLIGQFDQQLQMIEFQLSPSAVGQSTLDQMTDAILIREAAAEMGITVSEEEIVAEVEANFGYFPNGEPAATATFAMAAESTLSPTQIAMVTLTPTLEEMEEMEPTEAADTDDTDTDDADAEDAEDAETEEEAAPEEPTEVFEEPPTPTIVPTEVFGEQLDADMAAIAEAIQADEEMLREFFTERLYRDKVYAAITGNTPNEQEMVWARHILVATEEEALAIQAALADGADWGEQALEFSTDQSNNAVGGDLSWFDNVTMVPAFSEAAFSGEVGTITDPVETDFGWHLIQIVGHEMRPMSAEQYAQAQDDVFSAWLAELKEDAEITIYEYWTERVPTTPQINLEMLQQVAYVREQINAAPAP